MEHSSGRYTQMNRSILAYNLCTERSRRCIGELLRIVGVENAYDRLRRKRGIIHVNLMATVAVDLGYRNTQRFAGKGSHPVAPRQLARHTLSINRLDIQSAVAGRDDSLVVGGYPLNVSAARQFHHPFGHQN